MPSAPARFDPRVGQPSTDTDQRLGPRQRGYDARWDKASKAWRRAHPLCEYCLAGAFGECRTEAATRVDHLYPQRRFAGVFWVTEWWVSSCDACDAGKQALEHGTRDQLDELAIKLGRWTLAQGGL